MMKKCIQKFIPVLVEMTVMILNEIKLRCKYRNKS